MIAYQLTAGVDEAGRGPLAGPVVAAAVVLDPEREVSGLRDSKRLSPQRRIALARTIRRDALAFSVAYASVAEIDEINILNASLLAMSRALLRLVPQPVCALIDGKHVPDWPLDTLRLEAVVGGDDTVPAISAASILAKVCRDRLLQRLDRRFPSYGFAQHKGYPTAAHLSALAEHGPCEAHRRSFAPVARMLVNVS